MRRAELEKSEDGGRGSEHECMWEEDSVPAVDIDLDWKS